MQRQVSRLKQLFEKQSILALVILNCLYECACTTVEDIFWNVLCCASSVWAGFIVELRMKSLLQAAQPGKSRRQKLL